VDIKAAAADTTGVDITRVGIKGVVGTMGAGITEEEAAADIGVVVAAVASTGVAEEEAGIGEGTPTTAGTMATDITTMAVDTMTTMMSHITPITTIRTTVGRTTTTIQTTRLAFLSD